MLRAVALAVLLSTAAALVAAPVPPPTEKELIAKLYGKADGLGEFELSGKQLTIRSTVGRPNRDFNWDQQRPCAPRTRHALTGDFEVTVRVLDLTSPHKDAKNDPGMADVSAGLYVHGGTSVLRYSLSQSYQRFPGAANQNLQRSFRIEASYPRGGASGSMGAPEEGKSTYLRLIRKGKDLTMSHSADGEKWSAPNNPFKNIDMGFPDEVSVGIYLSHSTHQFAHATFDRFGIVVPK
ncbi:MAG: hypothetical protein ACKODX_18555 [Gemmata sp.]